MSGEHVIPEQVSADLFAFLRRVLVDGDEAAVCPPGTAAAMAGMIAGQRAAWLCEAHGMTQEAALAAVLAWVTEQARMTALSAKVASARAAAAKGMN